MVCKQSVGSRKNKETENRIGRVTTTARIEVETHDKYKNEYVWNERV